MGRPSSARGTRGQAKVVAVPVEDVRPTLQRIRIRPEASQRYHCVHLDRVARAGPPPERYHALGIGYHDIPDGEAIFDTLDSLAADEWCPLHVQPESEAVAISEDKARAMLDVGPAFQTSFGSPATAASAGRRADCSTLRDHRDWGRGAAHGEKPAERPNFCRKAARFLSDHPVTPYSARPTPSLIRRTVR